MRKTIKTVHAIDAPVDAVWEIIQRGDGVEQWIPVIGNSRLDGTNRRVCTMKDGAPLEETILKSDASRIFMYSIDKQVSFPVDKPVGMIRLEPDGGRTRMYWDLEFDISNEELETEFAKTVSGIYTASSQKLEELARNQLAA